MPITPDQAHNTIRHLGPSGGGAYVQSGNALGNNPGEAYAVGASDYGGPGDPTSGTHGYHGDLLTGTMAFAELDMGTALGDLPYRTKLIITYNGRSVIATKLDIGLGGGPIDGHPRCVDLWYETAKALDFNGTGVVYVERQDGKPLGGKAGKATSTGTDALSQIAGAPANAASDIAGVVTSTAEFLGKLGDLFFTQAGWIRLLKLFLGVAIGLITLKELFHINVVPLPV